jgi:serine/threonine-protein kinase RsbW
MHVVASTSGADDDHPLEDPGLPDLRLTGQPATAEALSEVRQRLTAWAQRAGLHDEQVEDVGLAAYEAMANVVDHAYEQPGGGVFDVHAFRHDDLVTVTVTDHGRWKAPVRGEDHQSWRGRGLLIIERVAREFELTPHARGTMICMSWPIHTGERSRS